MRKTRADWRRRFGSATVSLAAAMLLGAVVVGCGDSGSSGDGGSAGDGKPAAAHAGKRVAIVQSISDGYNIQVACGATEEGKKLGFEVATPQGPKQFDPARQVAITSAVLARNPDALVYLPSDPKASLQPVRTAAADGLKIAAIDTNLDDPSVVTSFIASDHEAGGRMIAEELIRELGGKGKVLTSALVPNHPITKPRVDGFEATLKSASGIEYLGARYPEIDIAKIAGDTTAALRRNPDITAIYTTNNLSTQGVVTALKDAGLSGKVKVFTWDYDEYGTKFIESGDIAALVTQQPREMGRIAVRQLANAFDGKPVEKEVHPELALVTQQNKSAPETAKLVYSKTCG